MANKKYENYSIEVQFPDGAVDTIQYTKEIRELDTSSYKTMLDVYRQTKEQYENIRCTIKFIGYNDNEKVEIFNKEINPDKVTETTLIQDDIEVVSEHISSMVEKAKNLNGKKTHYNTLMRDIYHKDIEFTEDLSENHKINTFDKLRDLLIERRRIDIGLKIYSDNEQNFKIIYDCVESIKEYTGLKNEKTTQIIEEYKEMGLMPCGGGKVVHKYTTEKQRIHFISTLQQKYDKIEIDRETKSIICSHKKKK